MEKNLKGKECGKGIYQRKDGLYHARFVDKSGKRHEKYFQTVPEAKNWIEEARFADQHEDIFVPTETTVDEWFGFWIENIVGDLAPNTLRNYRERYAHNIQPVIGRMAISSVKPMHCKKVLLQMDAIYAGSTIRQAYITMGTMFKAAKMNDVIAKHPMDGVRYTKPVRAVDDIKFLTRQEQSLFLQAARNSHNYYQYALILETGLRTGELIGLTWDAIDLEKRTLTVNKTLEFRHGLHTWRAGPPKTQHSYRTIPLTDRACEILHLSGIAGRTGKNHRSCPKPWSILTGAPAPSQNLSCVTLYLSTGERESQPRTAPMTHIFTKSAMRQESNAFVCTRYAILTPQEQSKAGFSQRYCRNCWDTPALKSPWIGMSM